MEFLVELHVYNKHVVMNNQKCLRASEKCITMHRGCWVPLTKTHHVGSMPYGTIMDSN